MIKSLNIGTKITLVVLSVVLLAILSVSFIAFNFSKEAISQKTMQHLGMLSNQHAQKLSGLLTSSQQSLLQLSKDANLQLQLDDLLDEEEDESDDMDEIFEEDFTEVATDTEAIAEALEAFAATNSFSQAFITDRKGQIIASSNNIQTQGNFMLDPDGNTLSESKKAGYTSNLYTRQNGRFMLMGHPIKALNSDFEGVIFAELPLEVFTTILQDTTELGKTGELLLAQKTGNSVFLLNKSRNKNAMKANFTIGEDLAQPLQASIKGKKGSSIGKDHKGVESLAAWSYISGVNWGLIAQIDAEEIYAEAYDLLHKFLLAGAVILVLALIVSIIFSRFLIAPMTSLAYSIQDLGSGILPDKIEARSNDEIGHMANVLDNMVQGLKRTATFAHKIGEGDFQANFKPMSDQDTLGTALLNMRDSIKDAELKDTERNWIVTGVAEIGEILRSHNDLEQLGDAVTAYVTQKIDAVQGAFYVVNDDDEQDVFIEMKASFAYQKKKYLKAKFRFAEGLVGQAAIEQDTLLRTEIPRDYVSITSGLLGDQRPSCLLVVPLITNEKVFGVVEFASFEKFNPSQIKFVQEISLIIARTIFNIKVNQRTKMLLEESQTMSNELQEKQEVLRQNAEEMEATQEELKRTNQRLEDQIEEVNRTQTRMQLLLENASEVITIYEEDGRVRYISPSVEKILGYAQNDLIGFKDIEHVHKDNVQEYESLFEQLKANPTESVTVQVVYEKKDGESIWLEATGVNRLNDQAIQGFIVNSRDITERRRAEQEERMRSQMQALSENSPDLITRFNNEGTVFYINPVIESYTGQVPEHFLRKNISEAEIEPAIAQAWSKILADVAASNEKLNTEIEFPSLLGDRVMQVNAIPEYNSDDAIESVLVVSHDITDRKLIEMEVQTKNKKITESINYAKRIQGAILPNNTVIRQELPDSFILYKAKDVVSGDFPWFMQVGDDIYIAAVDCTGHGVPGALISLIGYFLLNDIVRSRKISNPGVILDQLDEGVTQTLRQDRDDSQTKDGMDIALCKINTKKGEVEYAGAHRPLYFMNNGEMEEIKGNKFPIGGGIYKNQTNFTNTKLKVKKGDSIFFCSDGFPDQFGGPDNRKFGPKRLRQLVLDNYKKDMAVAHDAFDEAWEGWKGAEKQTDDVLLIGIKF